MPRKSAIARSSKRLLRAAWNAEPLEPRVMLSAAPASLAQDGFTPTAWHGHASYARPGDYILHLAKTGGMSGSGALAHLNAILAKRFPQAHAVADLGAGKYFEINTPTQVSIKQLTASLKRLPGFVGLEPNQALWLDSTVPTDPNFYRQWALQNTGQTGGTAGADIHATDAWDSTTGRGDVVVAEIDTGVAYTHPDLAANIWTNPGEIAGNGTDDDGNGYVDDVRGYNFFSHTANPYDDAGHGTHVAGIIGAVANNNAGVSGVDWHVKIMPLKFLSSTGTGTSADAIAAINYVIYERQHGVNVRVINASWGGNDLYSTDLYDAVNAAGQAGILFVAAAGNSGANNDTTPFYPSNLPLNNVVAVAATDDNDQLASFSNYGSTTVDLGAPGVDIYSTWLNNGYAYLSGTSMAAPFVTGAAALAFDVAPNATPEQVKLALLQGADPINALTSTTISGGRLDVANTLQLINSAPVADAGGPYSVAEGGSVTLSAAASSDADQSSSSLQYLWDLNGDGIYGETGAAATRGDEVGINPTYLAGPGDTSAEVSLQVIDYGHMIGTATATIDIANEPPTALLAATELTNAGLATYNFTVTYSDNTAVDASSLGGGNLLVTGPNGYSQAAALFSVANAPDGIGKVATYSVTAPDSTWSTTDDGTYTVALQPDQVRDSVGNAAVAGDLGTFDVNVTGIVPLPGVVVGRYVFYNHSAFDGNDVNATLADDGAIATDKTALLPGQTATFANYTSYSRGLNGIMVDIANLPAGASLSAADFTFRVGNDANPAGWAAAPAPLSVLTRVGMGVGGSDRVEIVFADNAIQKQWLQITLAANARSGLIAPDVFYFGNAIGESGNLAGNTQVNATDEILARNNPRNFLNPAAIDNAYDYNHDKKVDATDQIIARQNGTNFLNALKLLTV